MKKTIPLRMVELTLWAMWALLIAAAVVWLLIGAVSYWIRMGMLAGTVPDWVQAIGSMGAIAAGFAVAYLQKRNGEHAAQLEREHKSAALAVTKRDYLERASVVAAHAAGSVGQVVDYRIDSPVCSISQFNIFLEIVRRAGVDLERISIDEFETSRLVDAWLGFKKTFYFFHAFAVASLDERRMPSAPIFGQKLNEVMFSLENFESAVLSYRAPAGEAISVSD